MNFTITAGFDPDEGTTVTTFSGSITERDIIGVNLSPGDIAVLRGNYSNMLPHDHLQALALLFKRIHEDKVNDHKKPTGCI